MQTQALPFSSAPNSLDGQIRGEVKALRDRLDALTPIERAVRFVLLRVPEWSAAMRRSGWLLANRHGTGSGALTEPARVGSDPFTLTLDQDRALLAGTSAQVLDVWRDHYTAKVTQPELVKIARGAAIGFDDARGWRIPQWTPDAPRELARHTIPTGWALVALYSPALDEPTDVTLIDTGLLVRDVSSSLAKSGAVWDPDRWGWVFPLESAERVYEMAIEEGWSVDELTQDAAREQRALIEHRVEASKALDADISVAGLNPDLELMAFQRAGVAYASETRRCFIADEMGLGKTVQAIATFAALDAFPAIVVCPASLRLNWRNEIHRWLPGRDVHVLEGRKPKPVPAGADVVVVNYDITAARLDDLKAVNAKALALDEVHYCKTPKAQRTVAVRELVETLPDDAPILGLTGTPLVNRPHELWAQLEIIGRADEFAQLAEERLTVEDRKRARTKQLFPESTFGLRWCDSKVEYGRWDHSGSSNEEELHQLLRERCYVRRRKRDVIDDFPPLIEEPLVVPMSKDGAAEYRRAKADIVSYCAERAAEIAALAGEDANQAARVAAAKAKRAEDLARLNHLRQIASRAKMPAGLGWAKEFLDSTALDNEKLIVFAYYKATQQMLIEAFEPYGVVSIRASSEQNAEEMEAGKAAFQDLSPGTPRVIVVSLGAGREGHTLTAAHTMLMWEQPWSPSWIDQAAARAYGRLSDMHGATLVHLLADDSIDLAMNNIIARKRQITEAVTDGVVDEEETLSLSLIESIASGTEPEEPLVVAHQHHPPDADTTVDDLIF